MRTVPPPSPRSRPLAFVLLAFTATASACGGGAPEDDTGPAPAPADASEAAWRALATPRPTPVEDAPRVTVGTVEILASPEWGLAPGVDASLAVAELASAGLLERRDVRFVERRRFARAAEAERRGLPRPDGAPPVGVSPGAELTVNASWASVGLDSAYLELRLTELESGDVVATRRIATADDADPVSLARTLVGSALEALEELGRLPDREAASGAVGPSGYRGAGVARPAIAAFLRGLAAEERWDWEPARRGYEEALARTAAFPEAAAALARTARLRTGGTLGES